ncbi:MAG: mannose-6-phosphate isomerase type [Ferruginibacter sp.]|nr:mannose-6-phosphate isomerase type [Ferruginibacter sp.]
MSLHFSPDTPKELVFENIAEYLHLQDIKIDKQDSTRPWGGFFVIDEAESEKFIQLYFPHLSKEELIITGKLSPKILVVAPEKRLSWQYHHRRAEIWKLIEGTAGVVTSDTDEEKEITLLKLGDIIQLKQGERHRLIGLEGWGIIAEIWRHTDETNPSDEDDIVRVQDDFGR